MNIKVENSSYESPTKVAFDHGMKAMLSDIQVLSGYDYAKIRDLFGLKDEEDAWHHVIYNLSAEEIHRVIQNSIILPGDVVTTDANDNNERAELLVLSLEDEYAYCMNRYRKVVKVAEKCLTRLRPTDIVENMFNSFSQTRY